MSANAADSGHRRWPDGTPRVTTVIACYNSAATIAATIASVRAQTHQSWELVCIDDGSSDDTARILERFASLDQRIRWKGTEHRGQPAAKNAGVRLAHAEHVLILDADDILHPDALHVLLMTARRAGVNPIVSGGHELLDARGRRLEIFRFPSLREFTVDEFLQGNRIPVVSLVPRSLLGDEPFDETLDTCNDWNLWLKLAASGAHCVITPRVIFGYRLHSHSMSRSANRMFGTVRRLINRWRSKASNPEVARDVLHRFACNYGAAALASGDRTAIHRYFADLPEIEYDDACLRAMSWHIRGSFEFVRGADGETWPVCADDWMSEIDPWLRNGPLADYADYILACLAEMPRERSDRAETVREFLAERPNVRNVVVYGLGRNGVKLLEHMRREPAFGSIHISVADDHADELTFAVQNLPRDDPREWETWPAETLAIVTPNECEPMVRTLERAGGRAGLEFLRLSPAPKPALVTE
jgi:GT2 family glycosyltransferase